MGNLCIGEKKNRPLKCIDTGYAATVVNLPDGAPVLRVQGRVEAGLKPVGADNDFETKIQHNGQYFMIKAYMVQMLVLILRQIHGEEKAGKSWICF